MKFSSIIGSLAAVAGLTSAFEYRNTTTTLVPTSGVSLETELTTQTFDHTSTITLLTTITWLNGEKSTATGSGTTVTATASSEPVDASLTLGAHQKAASVASAGTSEVTSTVTSEEWSTITSTMYTTHVVTLSNSIVSSSVSAYEKQIVIGTSVPTCSPETVTVTAEKTQYVTVTATAGPTSSSVPTYTISAAPYSNSTMSA